MSYDFVYNIVDLIVNQLRSGKYYILLRTGSVALTTSYNSSDEDDTDTHNCDCAYVTLTFRHRASSI